MIGSGVQTMQYGYLDRALSMPMPTTSLSSESIRLVLFSCCCASRPATSAICPRPISPSLLCPAIGSPSVRVRLATPTEKHDDGDENRFCTDGNHTTRRTLRFPARPPAPSHFPAAMLIYPAPSRLASLVGLSVVALGPRQVPQALAFSVVHGTVNCRYEEKNISRDSVRKEKKG